MALLAGGLASCLADSLAHQLSIREMELSVEDVTVTVIQQDGPIERIEVSTTVAGPEPVEKQTMDRAVSTAKRTCHILAAIDPDIPVSISWSHDSTD